MFDVFDATKKETATKQSCNLAKLSWFCEDTSADVIPRSPQKCPENQQHGNGIAKEATASRSLVLGAVCGGIFYVIPWGLEITIMVAIVMPGVYWAFAFMFDGTLEILQEERTAATAVCALVYLSLSMGLSIGFITSTYHLRRTV